MKKVLISMIILSILFTCSSAVNALDDENATLTSDYSLNETLESDEEENLESGETIISPASNFVEELSNASNNDTITLEKGTYKLSDVLIDKNITIQGNGDPRDVIIDGEHKSSIFLIRSDAVHVSFKNITFINANVQGFGGAISMETGHVYVDNCHFINNTASVNAGGISNYGTMKNKGYLFVNNSLFVNNYAGHDGGAVTTCYANSDIYNCVFIGNSAHRDGGAIRVSVQGYGNVQDCIFMYNHADEWGGAYYSWSGTSNINRCIFLNNTAGTNGGAVMVSGDINLENSIIVNNSGGETGGSFYIQQPMYDAKTVINIHDNLITNNTSPYGKEIYIYWNDTAHLYTKFNNNDWGDEDPNDPSVIDPSKVTPRSKVTSTIKSNLLSVLSLDLLTKYSDIIGDYFPDSYLDNIKNKGNNNDLNSGNSSNNNNQNRENNRESNNLIHHGNSTNIEYLTVENKNPDSHENDNEPVKEKSANNTSKNILPINNLKENSNMNNSENVNENGDGEIVLGNSTSYGRENSAYELNVKDVSKTVTSPAVNYFILPLIIIILSLIIGFRREKTKNK